MNAVAAVLLLAVAAHCAARLVQSSRAAARAEAASHAADLLMALGLAAMLSPLGSPVPGPVGETVFGVVVVGSLVAIAALREPGDRLAWAQHAVGAAVMVFMFAAMPTAMSGMGGAPALLIWPLVAYFALSAVGHAVVSARGLAVGAGGAAALVVAPPVTSACHAAMAVCMAYLLLLMR